MKRKFDQLRAALDEFAQQDEFPMLVIGARPDDLAYVLKFLQSLEQTLPSHLIAAFHQPFTSPGAWIDALVESVRLQLDAAERPVPALPLELSDPRRPPASRLAELLQFLPRLLPDPDEYRIVVGLLPLECRDLEAYAALIAGVVPHPEVPAWMAPLRLIAWDDLARPLLRPALRSWPAEHVLLHEVDFSTPALTDSLSLDAADRSLPVPERMLCLLQLAAIDFSYKRHADALDKYAALHDYYERERQPGLQALCLQGAGDTLHAAGDSVMAKQRLQQAVALALASASLPVLLTSLSSITDVCMALGQHAEAESYADSGSKVAAGVLNPFAYCELHEKRGDAQLAQARHADAQASYARARELCRTYQHLHCWKSVAGKLAALYGQAGMRGEQQEFERERAMVVQLEARRGAPR
ncbi:hypothetical protein ACNOYE_07065 [Nannocystaceae bacterium ST9]